MTVNRHATRGSAQHAAIHLLDDPAGRARRRFAVPVSLCLVLALAACGDGEPEGALAIVVEDELRAQESHGQAALDFDAVVEGGWTRVAVVCGASDAVIVEALGFSWEQPRESGVRSGFAYVFATGDRVEQFFGPVTVAPFDDRTYVSSCDWSAQNPVTLRLFDRRDATIRYELRDDPANALGEAWFLAPEQGTPFGDEAAGAAPGQ